MRILLILTALSILARASAAQTTVPSGDDVQKRMEALNAKAAERRQAAEAAEIDRLRADNASLQEQVASLTAEVSRLKAKIEQLAPPASESGAKAKPPESGAAVGFGVVQEVRAGELVGVYAANELDGDARYKGRSVIVTGVVDRVATDILGSPYVTIGSGKQFEARQVQAMFDGAKATPLASLKPGQTIRIRGRVDGLMMNVLMRDCEIAP